MKTALPLLATLLALLSGCATPASEERVNDVRISDQETVIYVRSGCPYCESALDLLYGEGFRPVVREVTRDRSAYRELQAIYRTEFPDEKMIVPVLVHKGRYLRGYHPRALSDFLALSPGTFVEGPGYCENPPEEEAGGTAPRMR